MGPEQKKPFSEICAFDHALAIIDLRPVWSGRGSAVHLVVQHGFDFLDGFSGK